MARRRRSYGSVRGPRKGRIGAGSEFLVNPAKCQLKPGELLGADRRYTYIPYRCLSPVMQRRASSAYPHKTPGIPDAAYAYPFSQNEMMHLGSGAAQIARARRALMWGLKRTSRKVRRS